jgi:predicted phage-related endonuclease
MCGTPDALTTRPHDDILVEIKTAGARQAAKWGEPGTDQIPDHYLLQVQWYLTLTKRQAADIAVLLGGQEFRLYHLAHNPTLEARLLEIGEKFWKHNVLGVNPPEIGAGKSAAEWLRQSFPREERPELLPSDDNLDLMAVTLKALREQRDAAGTALEAIENQIKQRIADAAGIEGRNWRATWKAAKGTAVTDWPQVALDLAQGNPVALQAAKSKFTTNKPGSRRFLFNFKEE